MSSSLLTPFSISSLLAKDVIAVVHHLLPNAKQVGNEMVVGSLAGEKGESLKIHTIGDKAGIWCDFADKEKKGDLLDLWSQVKGIPFSQALKEAKKWLHIDDLQYAYHPIAAPKEFTKLDYSEYVFTQQNMQEREKEKLHNYFFIHRAILPEIVEKYLIDIQPLNVSAPLLNLNPIMLDAILFPSIRKDLAGKNELISVMYLRMDRPDGKKVMKTSPNTEPCLFGWHLIDESHRELIICEGQIDCMSLHQYGFKNVLSVPYGAGNHQWLEYEYDRLMSFDTIYLCFDNDEPGRAGVQQLLPRLGHSRCRIVTLPHKDANECLQKGMSKDEIQTYFEGAFSFDPKELKPARMYVDEVIQEFYPKNESEKGMQSPWKKVGERILFRPSELSLWSGINGHGKSQFLGHLVLSFLQSGSRVCIASLELKPQRLLARMSRQVSCQELPSENYLRQIHQWYGEKLWLFDLVGTTKTQRILEVFLYARQRYGVDIFVIDSLMKCGIAEDDYRGQKEFIDQLCDFKNEYDCHIHLVLHPRKPQDEYTKPSKLDMKGTGAVSDLADNCFIIWRNKIKETQIQQLTLAGKEVPDGLKNDYDCLWICDKQRNGEWEGRIPLWFDSRSFRYLESCDQEKLPYIEEVN